MFHVALALPLVGLLAKLHKWTESAMFFDGTGIGKLFLSLLVVSREGPKLKMMGTALHVAIIIIYLTIHIQSLRTFRTFAPPLLHPFSLTRINVMHPKGD